MKLNKIKNELLHIFIVLIAGLIINIIAVTPIKAEVEDLKDKNKEVTSNTKENIESKKINKIKNDKNLKEDDIVLNIEKEFSKFINVIYVNKFVEWDENNNEDTKIELKVSGTIDQLFKINDEIEKIKGKNIIESIQINKKTNNNVETEEEIKVDIIDCVITLKVG
jgi:FtsZ-binding cell division protein ZapB